jgi:two-component system phosphate regulon response regulator PhoB
VRERVVIVEDNVNVREALAGYLRLEEIEVTECGDLASATRALTSSRPHLVILDVMLPDGDGFLFAKNLTSHSAVPILFLTARDQESDRITGLELGADDYVVKPFSPREVVLRVKAILKRTSDESAPSDSEQSYTCENRRIIIDSAAHRITADEEQVTLTTAEWRILLHLAERSPQVVSRSQLLEDCLGSIAEGSERTIDTHVKNIRRKLGMDGWVETVRGFGYRFAGTAE